MVLNRKAAPPLTDFIIDTPLTPNIELSSSGVRIHSLENKVQPIARVEFVFKAGKWYQPKAGVASLTAKMLKEGTSCKSAKQIADIIDFYGASLEINHGFDRSTLTLYCLSKYLLELLPLAVEILSEPSFPEEEFELVKQRVIQTLAVDKQKNSYLSSELFTASVYGKEHAYSTLITEEEIAAIELKDISAFHSTAYSLSSAEVFVTGDISSESKALLLSYLNQKEGPSDHTEGAITDSHQPPTYISEASNNQMQASIRIGKPIISLHHSDYPGLYLLNHTLGGYFGSRLMKNIREDKGFTYGIYSSISNKEKGSLFSIGTDIKGDKIKETIAEVQKELIKLQDEVISDDELLTVKKHLAGKFISDSTTIFDKMDKYKATVFFNLSPNFYTELQASIKEITSEELRDVAKNYFQTDSMFTAIVGGEV